MINLPHQNFTIYEVEEYKNLFAELTQSKEDIEIDFENISKIDFAGVSLLISLAKTCENQKIKLKFLNLQSNVISNFCLCGCDKHLRSYYE